MSDASDRIASIIAAQEMVAPQLLEELDNGALVSDVILLVKYVDRDGRVGLSMAWPSGQDWIARRGMVETFRDMERVSGDD